MTTPNQLSDEDALKLGRKLAELFIVDLDDLEAMPNETLAESAKIVIKLAEPVILGGLREPSPFLITAGGNESGHHSTLRAQSEAKRIWQAMIDARLGEIKGD